MVSLAFVAAVAGYHCRTRLAAYPKVGAVGFLTSTVDDDAVQKVLDNLYRLVRGDVLPAFDDLRWVFCHLTVAVDSSLDESGLHHTAVVGDGVIECERIDRRYLCLIAYAHPQQCRLAPVFPLTVRILLWHADLWHGMAYDRNLDVLVVDACPVDAAHKLLRVVVVELIHHVADTDVGAQLHGPS